MKNNLRRIIKEEINDFDGGLEYIDKHYNEVKSNLEKIKTKIMEELPIIGDTKTKNKVLDINKYSEMSNWSPYGNGLSATLRVLADKLVHMIDTGKSHSIKPMLKSITSNVIKKLKKPSYYGTESLGKGHFRWNNRAYTLTPREINRVKEFFNL